MPSKPVLAARSIMDTSCIIGVPITSSTKSPNTASLPPKLSRTQKRYDSIPNGCRNTYFRHYRQIFHSPICMKDVNLIGLCSKAAIRATHIICHKQVQVFCDEFSTCVNNQIARFRSETYTHQASSRPFIASVLINRIREFFQYIRVAYQS